MDVQVVEFKNKGMYQDSSISKSSDDFAFENRNIRITAMEDNTLLSVTNEKNPAMVSTIEVKAPLKPNYISYDGKTVTSEYKVYSAVTLTIKYFNNGSRIDYVTIPKGSDTVEKVITGTITSLEVNPSTDDMFAYYTKYQSYPSSKESIGGNIQLTGTYLGHCTLGNYITVFTHASNGTDYIFRLHLTDDKQGFYCRVLYQGNLNFDTSHPIEAMGDYESEDIQKVYWVDGKNQTRFINISNKNNNIYNRLDTQFDFVSTINKYPKVKIDKNYNGYGEFPSGVIQYFVTYYNKFGAQSSIVWSSTLHYITFKDRGAKADEKVTCNFDIEITDLDHSFEYLRVYSVKRTSLEGPPEVNIIADVSITDKEKVTIVDANANQETVDPNILFYIGGSDFIASTLEKKDNVLFLGNIELADGDLSSEEKALIKSSCITKVTDPVTGNVKIFDSKNINFIYKCFPHQNNARAYSYRSQLTSSSKYFKSFKRGEIYRFAIQLQNKKGQWTNPVWIGDKECNLSPNYDLAHNQVAVSTIHFYFPEEMKSLTNKYHNYRILMAETSNNTRNILAQGIVSPTVFNIKERVDNKPFSVSSWIMRPQHGNAKHVHMDNTGANSAGNSEIQLLDSVAPPVQEPVTVNEQSARAYIISFGFAVGHQMWYKIGITDKSTLSEAASSYVVKDSGYDDEFWSGWKGCYNWVCDKLANFNIAASELGGLDYDKFWDMAYHQGHTTWELTHGWSDANPMNVSSGNGRGVHTYFYLTTTEKLQAADTQGKRNNFYIDSSILTFHSPEIQYDSNSILDGANLQYRIVGIAPIDSNYADCLLETSSSGYAPNAGYIGNEDNMGNTFPAKTFLSDFVYQDQQWQKNGSEFELSGGVVGYKVYMWNKQGSIMGQTKNLYENQVDFYSKLKHKIIANCRFSNISHFLYEDKFYTDPISTVSIFNSDEMGIKIIDTGNQKLYYYGNYDKLLAPGSENPYHVIDSANTSALKDMNQFDPVRIKFKSTPHAVFAVVTDKNVFKLLPRLSSPSEEEWSLQKVYEGYNKNSWTIPNDAEYPWGFANSIYYNNYQVVGIYHYDDNLTEAQWDAVMQRVINDAPNKNTGMIAIFSSSKKTNVAPTDYWGWMNITISSGNYVRTIYNSKSIPQIMSGGTKSVYTLATDDGNFFGDYRGYISNQVRFSYSKTIQYVTSCSYKQGVINSSDLSWDTSLPYLYIAELYRKIPYNSLYGGYEDNALESINWIPISDAVALGTGVKNADGDTYYQRWDCLKTYPFTEEDENSVVDITSVMIETHINLDGRCDVNRGNVNILNARPTNFGLLNTVYSQTNNLFRYNVLDDKFDLSVFRNQIVWSLAKNPTADLDNWTNVTLSSTLNLDGNYGSITKITKLNDTLVAFQDKAISTINFNNRTQISTEQGVPIELANSGRVDGATTVTNSYGCQNKHTIVQAKSGVYFIDGFNHAFMRFGKDGLSNVSVSGGMSTWFKKNLTQQIWTPDNNGFKCFYDNITGDVYIVNSDNCLVFNEQLETFTSFMDNYVDAKMMFNIENGSYIYFNQNVYKMFEGDYMRDINGNNSYYSVTYRVNPEPFVDKTFTNIEYIADCLYDEDINKDLYILTSNRPFDKITAWNEYQYGTAELKSNLMPSTLRQKFRIWRADIPRDVQSKYKIDRMRGPWIFLKLENTLSERKMVFHNLLVKYYR